MRRAPAIGAMVIALGVATPAAWAQTRSEPRLELSGTLFWVGGSDFGSRAANLTGNEPGSPDVPLFQTSTRLGSGLGPEGRLQVAISERVGVEAGVSWTHHTLESHITADTEGAPDVTASQSTSTLMAGADITAKPGATFAGGRGRPFVFAGGGYVRRAGEQGIVASSGAYFDAGGGVKYRLSSRGSGFPRAVALRADARLVVRTDRLDAASEAQSHAVFAVAAGLSVGF